MYQQNFNWNLSTCNATKSSKKKLDKLTVDEFYGKYAPFDKFPKLKKNAAQIIAVFGSTCLCELMQGWQYGTRTPQFLLRSTVRPFL